MVDMDFNEEIPTLSMLDDNITLERSIEEEDDML